MDKIVAISQAAAAEVCKVRSDVVFLHWGAGGELESVAKNYAAEVGLLDKYLFLGFTPHPEELYATLAAFLLTSRAEALGTSVLDAMTQGIPVVATAVGGLKETLAEQRGLLAPAHDARALAEHLIKVLSAPEASAEMVRRAREYVQAKHNAGIMIDSYVNLYQDLLA